MIVRLLLFALVVCLSLATTATVYNCKDGLDLYVNTPDYKISCKSTDRFTITFGPQVKIVTPINCNALRPIALTFSDSVTIIQDESFYFCTDVATINFGNGLISIGDKAFYYMSHLSTLVIPDSVISIGKEAFSNAYTLNSLTLGSGLQTIGDFAFYAASVRGDIVFPASLINIGEFSFSGLPNVNSLTLNEGLTYIPSEAFSSSSWTMITISNSVEVIGSNAFAMCTSLKTINWGTGLIELEDKAFYKTFSRFKTLTLPDSLQTIGYSAFAGCLNSGLATVCNLTSVTFGSGLQTIGVNAFKDVSTLRSLTFTGNNLISVEEAAFQNTNLTSVILPEGLLTIKDSAFKSNLYLSFVQLPRSLTSIGNHSFEDCTSLSSFGIPNTVTAIGESAFSGCSALQCVYWDETVSRTIGENAFDGCPLSGCGPSAIPTLRPTAVPSLSFRPSVSRSPTLRPTYAHTVVPSVRPSTMKPTNVDPHPEYSFSLMQTLTGISASKFDSKDGNALVFKAALASCLIVGDLGGSRLNISILSTSNTVVRKLLGFGGGGTWGGGGGFNSSTSTTYILYEIVFTAVTVELADEYYNVLVENIFNATESGFFTESLQNLIPYYDVSGVMDEVYSDYVDVYTDLAYLKPVDDDSEVTTTVDSITASSKKKVNTTLIVGVVVGVGGGLWFIGISAMVFYYCYCKREDKIVPTVGSTAIKYELEKPSSEGSPVPMENV